MKRRNGFVSNSSSSSFIIARQWRVRRGSGGRFESFDACKRIRKAVIKLISNRFCGIVGFGPWCHPQNTVVNCFALTLDGGVQYKFSMNCNGDLIVAEVRSRYWIDLPVKPSETIKWEKLEAMIPKAKTRDVFGMYQKRA